MCDVCGVWSGHSVERSGMLCAESWCIVCVCACISVSVLYCTYVCMYIGEVP